MKNIKDIGVCLKSGKLSDKRIAFGICGGIGAVETVKIIRELRRHGSQITAYFTPSVTAFISELSIEWATGLPVVSALTASVDFLEPFDITIIVPTTLNTLSKAAIGLSDNPVTLLIATQLGRKEKLLFVPTMNSNLVRHPLYQNYKNILLDWGAHFFPSEEEEGRLKMPSPERLADFVISHFT